MALLTDSASVKILTVVNKRFWSTTNSILVSAIVILAALLSTFSSSDAATLNQSFVRFDRMKISTATTGTVCAKAATVSTEATVQVVFPTGYTLGLAATFTVSTTNLAWPTGGTAWPGIGTATNVSSQTVTFPSTDLTVGTLYCFNWTNTAAVTTKSSATASNSGTISTFTSVPALVDSASFTTATVTNDQIVVTATVPQTFSFALSGNTDALGTLSTGSVTPSPTPRQATVNTNAKNGWIVWAKDANTGLTSSGAAYTIPSTTPGTASTLVAGTNGYNMGVTSSQAGGTGDLVVTPAYAGSTSTGAGLDTSLRAIATSDGTAVTANLTMTNNVAISNIAPAATDYTDTITVVGAGLF
jgi:hypothetical protein